MVHTQLKQGVNEKVICGRIDIQLSTEAVVCRFPEFFCHPTHGRRINDGSVKALPPKKPGTVICTGTNPAPRLIRIGILFTLYGILR